MRFLSILLQFLLPHQCPCCEKLLEEGQLRVCSDCLSKIQWIRSPICSTCGIPFISQEVEDHPCGDCLTQPKYFTMARASGIYEGILQKAIHDWKYKGKTYFTLFFGEWMKEGLNRYWKSNFFDLLIPVPLHPRRLRQRGFNQSLLLVKELSRHTGIPFQKGVLQKEKPTPPQVDLKGVERERALKGVFKVTGGSGFLEGKTILLIDDVYTTGATVNECSKVLLKAGAKRVDVLTLAHTLKKS